MSDKTLAEIHAEERAYYLGKADKVPESVNSELAGMTVADAQAKHRENVAKDQGDQAEATRIGEPEEGGVETATVPEGGLPDESALNKLRKGALVNQAKAEGVTVEDEDTVSDIVTKILAARA